MDEASYLKKLKEQEKSDLQSDKPAGPGSKQVIALLLWTFLLVLLTAGAAFLFLPKLAMVSSATPVQPGAAEPGLVSPPAVNRPADAFELTLSSISISLLPDTVSTVSFLIRRTDGDESSLCNGRYEVIDLSQVQLLHAERFADEKETAVQAVRLSLVAYDEETAYRIGDEIPLYDGDVGLTEFSPADGPSFVSLVNRFTDGISGWVVLDTTFVDANGRANGGSSQGIPEPIFFQRESDLYGHSIALIRREIHQLIIQPNVYSFEVTWSFWEHAPASQDHWLQVAPQQGSRPPGGSQEVLVTFTSSSMLPGSYHASLLLDWSRNCARPMLVPVTMTILAAPP